MDEEGIYAQILYPNLGGFGSGGFLRLKEPELMLECVRAYNDYLAEWTREDPERLVPVMATPFWDVAASVTEVERCALAGHRAVLMCGQPQDFGQPFLSDQHWDPLWAAAQEAGLSIGFHIGGGGMGEGLFQPHVPTRANFARVSSLMFVQNASTLADIIFGGVCHRFPELKFVSVESGAGWLQTVLEGMDWQWTNGQVTRDCPAYDLLQSEYFRRQIYGCFWFEQAGLRTALENFLDNLLWETDFPHPTCQHPNPANSLSSRPADYVARALGGVSEGTLQKVLHDNAAALYSLA
jgi:predicted TIM-barrel fold metal-dependent hydrolase